MHLTWQRPGGGGVHSGERGQQCEKEAAARGSEGRGAGDGSAFLEDGELEAAAQLWRAVRRRRRGSGGRGVGSMEVAARNTTTMHAYM